jgi:spermidine synthase
MTPGKSASRGIGRGALFALFTLSGFSGLIYESIWSHYLKLFLGHAAYAQTLVLTVFMGGMALGAWVAARLSPRVSNLLLVYALVEIVTGALALAFHPLYLASVGFTFKTVIPALDAPLAINAAKWLMATLLILPQSILLGATFPLVSGGAVRRFPAGSGATIAMLYFTNSLGAACGVLASGFWLIGLVGLPGTVKIAGMVNVLLGTVVWLFRGSERAPAPSPATAPADVGVGTRRFARRLLWVAFLSGAAAFIYEIAWIRMLSLVLGSSTHAFELMLSAFILGLALGGLVIRRHIDSLANPLRTLAIMFASMAILAILTLPAYGMTFDIIGAAMRAFAATDAGYAQFNLVSHAVAAAIMIPTTFVAGMSLPLITQILLKRDDERAIGRVYAANTIGAIAGVLIAVHGLLPGVGLKGTVLAGALIQLSIAWIVEPRPFAPGATRALRAAVAGGVALFVLVTFLVQLDPMRMASGVYRQGRARLPEGSEVLLQRDGKTATISIVRQADTVMISTNGKPDAAINMGTGGTPNGDEITMTMAGGLPLALHPAPRWVANIGIGSGLTSSVLLASHRLVHLDTIEIEPVMAQAARFGFGERVARVFEDPRSEIHYEDAKTFFAAAQRQYDVIVSEPSNPWVSGVATLFSDEFYGQIRAHLHENGLLVQWIQIYETDLGVVASILKALSPHFADYRIYASDDSDIVIVAQPVGRVPDLEYDVFAETGLGRELRRVGLNTLGDIDIRRIGDRRLLDRMFAAMPVPANSDFYPYVDLNAPRMRFLKRDALDLIRLAYLSIPIGELYGEPLRFAASDSQKSAADFARQRLAMEAHAILAALVSGETGRAPADAQSDLTAFMGTGDCAENVRANWLAATYRLSRRTTPHLPATDRAPLWTLARSRPCFSALTDAERHWFELLAAVGTNDNAGIVEQSAKFFAEPPPHLTGSQLLEALLVAVAARTTAGKPVEARELLASFLPALQNAGDLNLALKLAEANLHD